MKIKLGRNDQCWCGSGRKYKTCHMAFDEKIDTYRRMGHIVPDHSIIKTAEDIAKIKESAKINIAVLDYVAENIREGMCTQDIDDMVYSKTIEMGGIPAPLNYEGYPKSVCTSINDVVCHGIPCKEEILMDGDIINVDCSTILDGYFSDSSRMFMIGNVSDEMKNLVEVAHKSLEVGLSAVKPWGFLGDMGQAINDYVKSNGYSVVREIGGHGIGKEFHEDPFVSYVSKKGTEMLLVPGFCFTIEPMINMGKSDVLVDEDDDWTVFTKDGSPSAQWEIQLVVTEDGYEILSW